MFVLIKIVSNYYLIVKIYIIVFKFKIFLNKNKDIYEKKLFKFLKNLKIL